VGILDHPTAFDLLVFEISVFYVEPGVVFEVSEAQLHKLFQERVFL
jgi:hypothetical protein